MKQQHFNFHMLCLLQESHAWHME